MSHFSLPSLSSETVDEEVRVNELLALDILDTSRDARFDEILERICDHMGAISGRVSLIDRNRIWVKSSRGLIGQTLMRYESIEDLLVEGNFEIYCLSTESAKELKEPFIQINPDVKSICAIAIRSITGAIVGALVMAFEREHKPTEDLKMLYLAAASKYSDLLESRRVADSLIATMRDQQEELRIRSSSERIARTLTNPVLSQSQYHQVIESFSQTILNEFDWWGCQLWFENEGNLIPERWLFGPSAPVSLQKVAKQFTRPIPAPRISDVTIDPYSAMTSSIISPSQLDWFEEKASLEELGARKFIQVDVTGLSTVSIRLLFVVPSSRALPPRLKLTFENVIAILPQVLRRARSTEEMNYRATHDELTGLLNRRGLDIEFGMRPSQDGFNNSRTIFFLDLDRFKAINDTYGHAIGDEFLIEIALRLIHTSRPVDSIARIGGDEFVIVAQGFDQTDDVVKASERFLENIGKPFKASNGIEFHPRISIGISSWDPTDNFADVISAADKNMYTAKERGGNQAVSSGWSSTDLQSISNGEEFSIAYQQITDSTRDEVYGILARVQLPIFFAPRIITQIAEQIYSRAISILAPEESRAFLLLDIVTLSRSDRTNTLALVDSIAELSSKHSELSVIINFDTTLTEGIPLAREILSHGTARIAIGNIFDHPFDLQLIEDLDPRFLVRSKLSIDWSEGDLPTISDRTTLAIARELQIPVILPIEYSSRYSQFLANFPQTLYFASNPER